MIVTVIEPFLIETWTVYEMFRRIGFPADALFFCTTPDLDVLVQLQWHGQTAGVIRVCGRDKHGHPSREVIEQKWLAFLSELQTLPHTTLKAAWDDSKAKRMAPQIILGLASYGIFPPALQSPEQESTS